MTYDKYIASFKELYHFGIKGMRWGVRRYQNEDGSLTNAGKKRYSDAGTDRGSSKPEKKKYKASLMYSAREKRMIAEGSKASLMYSDRENRIIKDGASRADTILAAVGGIGIVAAGAYYATHAEKVDSAINRALDWYFQ